MLELHGFFLALLAQLFHKLLMLVLRELGRENSIDIVSEFLSFVHAMKFVRESPLGKLLSIERQLLLRGAYDNL